MDQLRKLHNNCKRNLIQKWVTSGSHVLDCGCGRGGDIHKWNSIPKLKITAVDPDEESLKEAYQRATTAGVGIWFLPPGDIQQAVNFGPYDVVCYNFSLHYIFESLDTYTKSIWALAKCIKTGGLLIGITPDRTRILSVLNSKPKFVDKLGNTIELRNDRLMVNLMGGPFYAEGGREEPILDPDMFIHSMRENGFRVLVWEPMLDTPNGLISDIYSKFVFVKQ
jgi:ubiquinone/menaquinone biosynthesis C-methylase UbiE